MRNPSKKIIAVRLNNLPSTLPVPNCLYFTMEKLIALPTANKNVGNTRSVGVNPFHEACESGEKGAAPLPWLLTIIIKQIVMPLNTSRARNRGEEGLDIRRKVNF